LVPYRSSIERALKVLQESMNEGEMIMATGNASIFSNEQCAQAIDKAKSAASSVGEMASHAASAVGQMANQAGCEVRHRADDAAANAGAQIHQFGDRMSREAPRSGMMGQAAQSVARGVSSGGQYLENRKASGIADDLVELVRQYPLPAILITACTAWWLGRKLNG
jgi:cell division septum initiation protein DivIVA